MIDWVLYYESQYTVWQTSPPSSLTTQPVSRLRLKLATLSQIFVQVEGGGLEEVRSVVGFG